MKKFIVTINAYDHYAKFEVESEDIANITRTMQSLTN